MDNFNAILLNIKDKVLDFHNALSSHFFAPYILEPTRTVKNFKYPSANKNSEKF